MSAMRQTNVLEYFRAQAIGWQVLMDDLGSFPSHDSCHERPRN